MQARAKAVINTLMKKVRDFEMLESGFSRLSVTGQHTESATSMCSSANVGRRDLNESRVRNDIYTSVVQIIVIGFCVIVGVVIGSHLK
ncbi:hypothetical protein LINPERPRIM_LOCUS33512 [Linum perenne]